VDKRVRTNKVNLTSFSPEEVVDIVLCADGPWAGVRMEVNVDAVDVALYCWSMIRVEFEQENNSAKRV
jgi:hypothetical protein